MALSDTLVPHAPPLRVVEGGTIKVGNTRVSLDSVVYAFENGATAEEILQKYPSLKLADIYATIAYYLDNRDEVRFYLASQEKEAAKVRARIEAEAPNAELRKRLLARQAAKQESERQKRAGGT